MITRMVMMIIIIIIKIIVKFNSRHKNIGLQMLKQIVTIIRIFNPSMKIGLKFQLLPRRICLKVYSSFLWLFGPSSGHGLSFRVFTIALRHTTICRTPLDEWSARRRDLSLTNNNGRYRYAATYASGGIWTRNSGNRSAADARQTTRRLESA